MNKITIKKENGSLTETHRQILVDAIRSLPDGEYSVIIDEKAQTVYTPTRYR